MGKVVRYEASDAFSTFSDDSNTLFLESPTTGERQRLAGGKRNQRRVFILRREGEKEQKGGRNVYEYMVHHNTIEQCT
jgi:hypothetical protein